MATFILDTRNQKDDFVEKALTSLGHKCERLQLYFGDVALKGKEHNAIDLKSSSGGIIELMKNVCSKDHARLKREIDKSIAYGGTLTFMVFEPTVKSMEDIANFEMPTFKNTAYKTNYYDKITGEKANKTQIKSAFDRDLKANKIRLNSTYIDGLQLYSKNNYIQKRELVHTAGDSMSRVNPKTLLKALKTMSEPNHYAQGTTIKFVFTNKQDCGKAIEKILLGDNNND